MKIKFGEIKKAVNGRNCQGEGCDKWIHPGQTYYELPFGNLGTPVCPACLEKLSSSVGTALKAVKSAPKVINTLYCCRICAVKHTPDDGCKPWIEDKWHSLESKIGMKHIEHPKNKKEFINMARKAKRAGVKLGIKLVK